MTSQANQPMIHCSQIEGNKCPLLSTLGIITVRGQLKRIGLIQTKEKYYPVVMLTGSEKYNTDAYWVLCKYGV